MKNIVYVQSINVILKQTVLNINYNTRSYSDEMIPINNGMFLYSPRQGEKTFGIKILTQQLHQFR